MDDQLSVLVRLDAVLERGAAGFTDNELLPSRLAGAAAEVLAVDGASLSLLSMDLRVPLGASSAAATAAERLQFTLGQGPCLEVLHGGLPSRSDTAELERLWPQFHRELTTTTPFRSVVAVPLPFTADGRGGALDLYLLDPDNVDRVDLDQAGQVADGVVERLLRVVAPTALAGADDTSKIAWLRSDGTHARMEVWVAVGVLIGGLGLVAADALAVLRAWAHSHDTDLDQVAAALVGGSLDPQSLRP